jgi:hypothetical protein
MTEPWYPLRLRASQLDGGAPPPATLRPRLGRSPYRGGGNYVTNTDRNNDMEYTCTNRNLNIHTTDHCGIRKWLNSGSWDDKICHNCGIPGHIESECRTDPNGFEAWYKVNKYIMIEDSKINTKATLSEAIVSWAEHKIATWDWHRFWLPGDATHTALHCHQRRCGWWTQDHRTICVTIEAVSLHSQDYHHPSSPNLAMRLP